MARLCRSPLPGEVHTDGPCVLRTVWCEALQMLIERYPLSEHCIRDLGICGRHSAIGQHELESGVSRECIHVVIDRGIGATLASHHKYDRTRLSIAQHIGKILLQR